MTPADRRPEGALEGGAARPSGPAAGAAPRIDVVIVDYNAGDLLRECLASIARHPPRRAALGRVVVVDNASSPPSDAHVPDAARPFVTVLRNERNRGFAAACNQGARGSTADYLLFLNPDTQLVPNSLDGPAEFLERPEHERVGIVGVQLLDDEGRVARTCSYHPRPSFYLHKALGLDRVSPRRFPSGMMFEWDHATTRRVDGVMGAFFFVRRDLFARLGGFDERFFVYFEETDFGYRADRQGYSSVFLADAQAYHRGCGTTDKVRAHRLTYSMRSRLKYARAHFSALGATAVALLTLAVEPVTRLLHALARGSSAEVHETLRGYRMLWSGRND
jgi:N-acetylglucosaminyl-diphospho-decaprenol L-rhamnosyltransferase